MKRLQISCLNAHLAQEFACGTALRLRNLVWCARSNYLATARAALRAYVYNVVGNLNHIEVMLNHNGGITSIHKFVYHAQQLANILKVQARSRLVKDVECVSCVALRELGSQLYSLALTARQSSAGLTQGEVSQSNILNSLQLLVNRRDVCEELVSDIHRHIQHIVYIFALIFQLQCLAVVAISAAALASHIYIGQEVHLNGLHSRTTTLLASSALYVEGEASRLEASDLCVGSSLKEFADVGKYI